jgi:hypothetical protein
MNEASYLGSWLFLFVNIDMSARLTKALEFANYRVTLNNQQAALKAKTQSLLSYSINGGTFTINMELINFTKLLIAEGAENAVLLDIYQNPIRIELSPFYKEILSRYYEVTNDYYAEYEKLRKARKVHKVLDLNEEGK